MKAIFDKSSNLVGWIEKEHVFDLNLNWIAFLSNGNIFSSNKVKWLGPFNQGSFLDRDGKPVAWIEGVKPSGTLKPLVPTTPFRPFTPLRPLNPLKPLKPLQPLVPLGGWSKISWEMYLGR